VDTHQHHIVLASTKDGSVVAWNLKNINEHAHNKSPTTVPVIMPSYCTDGVYTSDNMQFGCDSKMGLYIIQDLKTYVTDEQVEQGILLSTNKKGVIKFISMDESGMIEYWVYATSH
jgi:hypothetical protein